MNSKQIQDILSHDSKTQRCFQGVFPSDQLPEKMTQYPACFVCNVDPSEKPGSHWVAFYLPSSDSVEFFDSYGNAPTFFQGPISDFTYTFSDVMYNPLSLQSHVTAVCGQFCVYFLYARCRDKSLKTIVSQFVAKNVCNDHRVYNFVAKRFRVFANFYQ